MLDKHITDRIYYGYPSCCIKEFYEDLDIGICFVDRKEKMKAASKGFVPCNKHSILINTKKIKIESLITKNRRCLFPF